MLSKFTGLVCLSALLAPFAVFPVRGDGPHRFLKEIPIGTDGGWDYLSVDAAANGDSGSVTVVHEDSPDKFTVVQTLATEKGARTMQVDPVSHKIYLASAKFEAPAPLGQAPSRPRMVPGSFKILVYELAR